MVSKKSIKVNIIYCFISFVTGGLIVWSWKWFVKRKNQIQEKWVKYRYFVLTLIALSLLGVLIGTLINSKGEELGSWADWISAIMSFVAILVVFWQMNRELQNERAINMETKRPRFSVERTTVINSDEKILYHNSYGDLKTLYGKLHDKNHQRYIIRLTNVSDNTIYALKIILIYGEEPINNYAFDGLFSRQSLLLVTDKDITNGIDPIELWIKFETVANETGYFYFKASMTNNFAKYFFVKNKTPVSVYDNDTLVDKNSSKAEELKKIFRDKNYSYQIVTISEEEFSDLKRYIHEEKN